MIVVALGVLSMAAVALLRRTPAPPRRRGVRTGVPGKSAAERKELRFERWLTKLERADPGEYNRVMQLRHGLVSAKSDDSDLDRYLATAAKMRAAGFDGGTDGGGVMGEIAKAVSQGLALVPEFLSRRSGGVPRVQVVPHRPAEVPAPAGQIAAAVEAPKPRPKKKPKTTAVAAAAEPAADAPPMTLQSRWVVAQLEGKSPEDAAVWLLGLPAAGTKDLVAAILATPDEGIPALLDEVAAANPDAAGLVAWLHAWPNLMPTVHAIRERAGAVV